MDVREAANMLIVEYGKEASAVASRRAAEFLDHGDIVGLEFYKHIIATITSLQIPIRTAAPH